MLPLLTQTPDEATLAAILKNTHGQTLLPAYDSQYWHNLRSHPLIARWVAQITAQAEKDAQAPLPELTDELYGIFYRTGERVTFESRYFERRRILGRIALAVLMSGEPAASALLPALRRKIDETLDETSWSFPAHIVNCPSGKDPYNIDLFAAETANALAELLSVFAPLLEPRQVARIRQRLREQFFENYLDNPERFWWTQTSNNWNAVCHQGVIGAALTIEDDHALTARLLLTAARFLPTFIDGFGNDGSTSEGPSYWGYGFGRFAELNEQLEARTGGSLSLFEGVAKIPAIAVFGPSMALSGGYMVNFADGPSRSSPPPPLLSCLGQRLQMPELLQLAARGYAELAKNELNLGISRSDFHLFTKLLRHCPGTQQIEAAANEQCPHVEADTLLPDYGALLTRSTDSQGHYWEFAAKGGHNDEHHNHNDCGSYILHIDSRPAVIEIGSPEYNGAYFTPATRYSALAARSLGHSVPFVNGCEQAAGRAFAAQILDCNSTQTQARLTLDLTRCYPAAAALESLLRRFTLDKAAGILSVSDTFRLSTAAEVESMIILASAPDWTPQQARLALPDHGELLLSTLGATRIHAVDACTYNDHKGQPQQVYRLRLTTAAATEGSIAYRIHLPER